MQRRSYTLRDGELSALHFGDTSAPVRLVFLHANGFNAQSYRAVMERLGIHVVVFDMRGHGESRHLPQPAEMANWHIFRDDCVEFFDRYLPELTYGPVVLGGHSFGAAVAVLTASELASRSINPLCGYIGIDPPTVPYFFRLTSSVPSGRAFLKKRMPLIRKTGTRKSVFESRDSAFEHLKGRGAFKGVSDEVLRDYISGGLYEDEMGAWQLSCNPKWEQSIFTAQWQNLFKAARDLPKNAKFIYANGHPPVSTRGTRRAMARGHDGVRVSFDSSLGHLFPFDKIDFTAQVLREALEMP